MAERADMIVAPLTINPERAQAGSARHLENATLQNWRKAKTTAAGAVNKAEFVQNSKLLSTTVFFTRNC